MTSEAKRHIINGNLNFCSRLFGILSESNDNIFCSPANIHAILSLLFQGADEIIAPCFQRLLYLSDKKVTIEVYQNLIETLYSILDSKLHIANKLFIQENFSLKDEFTDIAKNNFLFEIESVNFGGNKEAAKIINEWVENRTDSKIMNLISPADLDILTDLVLVSAIYFNGTWLQKFDSSLTNKERFHVSMTESIDCDMMRTKSKFMYAVDNDLRAQILTLPYKNKNLCLMIILPISVDGIKSLGINLEITSLVKLYKNLRPTHVSLSLPKFKIETTIDLHDALWQMGFHFMFCKDDAFPYMLNNPESLTVTQFIQKTIFEATEEGVFTLKPNKLESDTYTEFSCDHPFIFSVIYDDQDTILPIFVGRCNKP